MLSHKEGANPGWISSCRGRQPASAAALQSLLVVIPGSLCSGAQHLLVTLYPTHSKGMPAVWLHVLASHSWVAITVAMAFDCLLRRGCTLPREEIWAPLFWVNQITPKLQIAELSAFVALVPHKRYAQGLSTEIFPVYLLIPPRLCVHQSKIRKNLLT